MQVLVIEILNSFNPELKLKDTYSAIKNKLKKLLIELRGFKFLTGLVLESIQIENDDKWEYDTFFTLKSRNNY